MNNSTYTDLLRQAELHFSTIQSDHPTSFTCRNGCHACCEPNLTCYNEANNIRDFLKAHPTFKSCWLSNAPIHTTGLDVRAQPC